MTSLTVHAPGDPARVSMLDVAKGLGILLVALGHNAWMNNEHGALDQAIGSFRLPFFFFIAGVTFPAARGLASIAKLRAEALIKPFIVVVLALGAMQMLKHSATPEAVALGLLYGTGFTLAWDPLWFLPHLWLVSVFAAFVLERGRRLLVRLEGKAALLCLLLLVGYPLMRLFHSPVEDAGCAQIEHFSGDLLHCGLPFSADIVFLTSAFFLLGHFLAEYVKQFVPDRRLLLATLTLFLSLWTKFHYTVNLNFRQYDHPVVSTVQALAAIYVLLCLCAYMARLTLIHRIAAYIGSGSLFVLMFHYFLQDHTYPLAAHWVGSEWIAGLLSLLVGVAGSLLLWELARRSPVGVVLMLPSGRAPRAHPPEISTLAGPISEFEDDDAAK